LKSFFAHIVVWLAIIVVFSAVTFLVFNRFIVPVVPVVLAIIVLAVTKTQRKLIGQKQTPIYEITEGVVKITGNISAPKTFETPYFKQQCIAYVYEEGNITYDSESGSEHVKNTRIEEQFQDFYLSNASGKIKVIAPKLNLAFLPVKTDTLHSIKYAVDDSRYTERTLKNGDLASAMGYARKNNYADVELSGNGEQPLIIATPDFEHKAQKSFRVFKLLLPYIILMYVGVNYFLFAPSILHFKENQIFPYFAIFGMAILSVVLALVVKNREGLSKMFWGILASVCFSTLFLSFPLVCLFYIIKLEYSRIFCIWLVVLACNLLAFTINYHKLETAFDYY
jgi:hypothetical protein